MNAFFYPRLALSGMRRDRRIYAPYLAACVFMTAVVYDLAFLADSPVLYAVGSGVNGMGTSAIRLVMTLGKWVMAVFALLFFFYTNAFLIRRRKKELGLMSVLGMDRGALTSLLFWETAFSALVSLTAGLALGVLLTQLSARVLSHFARTELPALPLLDLGAVLFCVLTDAFIFFLLLLNAWRQVRRASAVSLLRSDSLGERPPRSQWLLEPTTSPSPSPSRSPRCSFSSWRSSWSSLRHSFSSSRAALPSAARSKAMTGSITRRKTSSRSPRSSIV